MSSEATTTILFVDDEPIVLEALKRVFQRDGYRLLFCSSAHEALGILEKNEVQIVVSDYRMPGMSGGELMQEVSEKWPDTVRIILSGFADISSVVSAINGGEIYKFISKPWQNEELKEVISNAVERYWQRAELKALAQVALVENEGIVASYIKGVQELSVRHFALEDRALNSDGYRFAFMSSEIPMLLFNNRSLVDINHAAERILMAFNDGDTEIHDHPFVIEVTARLTKYEHNSTPAETEHDFELKAAENIRAKAKFDGASERQHFCIVTLVGAEHIHT